MIRIDSHDGTLSVDGFSITPDVAASGLPSTFQLHSVQRVLVLGSEVSCQFATAFVPDSNQTVKLDLRFEEGRLVSCFATFPDAAMEDEYETCRRWLVRKIGYGGGLAIYPWGKAGVATGPDGSSHVFLHNANNTWVG